MLSDGLSLCVKIGYDGGWVFQTASMACKGHGLINFARPKKNSRNWVQIRLLF